MASRADVSEEKPRTCGRQINRGNTPAETTSEYFKRTITIPMIDHLNLEINQRFDSSTITAYHGLSIIPSNVISSVYNINKTNWKSMFQYFATSYEDDFPSFFLGREDNYSIYNMLDKDISLLTFKALNNIAPNYICSKIQMAKNCHSHNTRREAKNHLQIPSSNTKFGMRTFAYRASKLWNDLPNELLDRKSLLKFKTSVKDFFN